MARDLDRDKLIDALLEGARRDPASQEVGPACLDAEELAAWADGGLDSESVSEIEKHVADCTRCQALSAAMFSAGGTAQAKRAEVVTLPRSSGLDWLPLAIGTIAATLVIWVGVDKQRAVQPESQTAAAHARGAEPPARSEESRPQGTQKQQGTSAVATPQGQAAAPAEAKRADGNAAPVETRADRATPQPTPTDLFRKAEPAPAPKAVATPVPAPVLPSAPPPPAVTVAGASPVVTPPAAATGVAGGVSGGAGGGVRQSLTLRESVEPRIVAEFSSVLGQASTISGLPTASRVAGGVAGTGAGRGGGGGGGRSGGIALDAVATGPTFYWRILSTDVIQRSVDKLKWEAVAIDPPVQGLAGGAAPSATVCWIVGRAGLILRTIDGEEFIRVNPPAPVDLIAIAAQNALQATVTTAGGQAFTTTDGGKTWK